jgi:hypothetical protein
MKKNMLKLSSLLTMGSMLLLTLVVLVVPGYASAATATATTTFPVTGVVNAVNAATCSGNIVNATISGGTVTFTNKFQKDIEVGAASYKAFENNIDTQELFDSAVGTVPACGTLTLSIKVPPCNYQLDAFLGPVLKSMNGQRYGSRLVTAKDMGTSDYCAGPGQAVGDVVKTPQAPGQNTSPEAVLDVVQIPSGLPQTGSGGIGSDNAGGWLLAGLIGLLGCSITAIVVYRRKLQK